MKKLLELIRRLEKENNLSPLESYNIKTLEGKKGYLAWLQAPVNPKF